MAQVSDPPPVADAIAELACSLKQLHGVLCIVCGIRNHTTLGTCKALVCAACGTDVLTDGKLDTMDDEQKDTVCVCVLWCVCVCVC
jgi:hypothetical protein